MTNNLYRVLAGIYAMEAREERLHYYSDEITKEVGLPPDRVESSLADLNALGKITSRKIGLGVAHRLNHTLTISQMETRRKALESVSNSSVLKRAIQDQQYPPEVLDDEQSVAQIAVSLRNTQRYPSNRPRAVFVDDGKPRGELTLEVAKTVEQRNQGLKGKTSLEDGHGLLFVFPDDTTRTLWMKDIMIPLDIIFLNSNWEITNIERADPQPDASKSELTRYTSDGPAPYVIETNQGFTTRIGVSKGTSVQYQPPQQGENPPSREQKSPAPV